MNEIEIQVRCPSDVAYVFKPRAVGMTARLPESYPVTGGDWLKVSSFRYFDKRTRAATVLAAFLGLGQWRDSDQFTGRHLRVAERDVRGFDRGYREILGIGQ